MGIWLPIVTNILIALVLVAGIFIGKKNGLLSIIKLPLVISACITCYFINPIIIEKILSIEAVGLFLVEVGVTLPSLIALSLSLLCLISYLIISILIAIVRVATKKEKIAISINTAKRVKIKTFDKKADKALRKEEKKLLKSQRQLRKISKSRKVIGSIFGFMTAIIIGFIIMFPIKYIFINIASNQENLSEITSGYEHTMYGQLDKITEVSNTIILEQFKMLIGE